jgi:hypothetical protein
MNLENFDLNFSKFVNLLKIMNFPKDSDSKDIRLYGQLLSYPTDLLVITSRLIEDINKDKESREYLKMCAMGNKRMYTSRLKKDLLNYIKLNLDLQDFYFYTRRFLDSLNLFMKSFFCVTRNNGYQMSNHASDLTKSKKLNEYKQRIDLAFFQGLEQHILWLKNFIDHRDGLVHKNDYHVFTTTRKGTLGFELFDISKNSWGTDTVKDLEEELQRTIDHLSGLIEYVSSSFELIWIEKNNRSVP